MKILYITPDITNSGGIARVISLKTNYLVSALNYEVSILTVDDSDSDNDSDFFYEFNPEIQWFRINKTKKTLLFLWRYMCLIKKTISDKNPDIVIICDAVLWVFIPWFIKIKMPVIFETHVSIYLKKIKKQSLLSKLRFETVYFFKRKTFKKFQKIIFETYGGSKEWNLKNSKVIPNPMSFRGKKNIIIENKKAIAVCRHSYEKGIDRLLEVWKRIIQNHPDWTLDIYGQWDTDLVYQNMANDLQVSGNVTFFEPRIDIQKGYEQSSILLMTSRSEAFGMVLIEAMNCGLPCIAYDCPIGPKAIIENNENGFLIEDGNIDLFVEKLEILIENEDLRLELGKKAKISSEQYAIETIMQTWTTLFEDLKN